MEPLTNTCLVNASMQALRHASFLNTPTLLGIQTLVMMGPYLTNTGRFLDAWTLFGTTIRLAHSMGLHRNPKFLDPVPPLRECMIRRTLWWWMLQMDQQYSVTLGRPLGISGIGDCPPPEPLTTNQTVLRLGEFANHFTIVARQILSSDGMMSVGKIDEYTDKLLGLWDTMPETLQFNESWTRAETALPEWPLDVMSASKHLWVAMSEPCANIDIALFAKVQSFLVLLNRQRDERTTRSTSSTSPPSYPNTLPGINSATYTPSGPGAGDGLHHQAPIRGRPLVINSSVQLLQTFLFFAHRHPAVLICWTIGQQAFNAAMIIILDACETENDQNMWLVDQAYKVFHQLDKDGVHKLAKLAVERISRGIILVENRQRDRRDEANAAAAAAQAAGMSRRPSQQQQQQQQQYQAQAPYQYSPHVPPHHLYQPILSIDNPDLASTDFSGDTIMANTVMGETGMFLLEDSGLQSHNPATQHFQPWSLSIPSSAAASSPHSSATSPAAFALTGQYSPSAPPMVPVSNVPIAPFPVMSPQFQPTMVPMLASPFAVGLQPRMPVGSGRGHQSQHSQQASGLMEDAGAAMQQHTRPQSMEGQQHQHASRTGYSPYQTQASRHSGTSRSHGHRSQRPISERSRSGRAR